MREVAEAGSSGWVSPRKGGAPEAVTEILEAVGAGDEQAAEKLLPLVYDELRRLAAAKMAQQPPGQTLQPTALVHEAWLKVSRGGRTRWEDRRHFFRAAAEAMRQILIDRARHRLRVRHGGGVQRLSVEEIEIVAPEKEEVLVLLNEALSELRARDPVSAEIVNLRFFAGLTEPEIASVLGISERSVQRQWRYVRAWLFAQIEPDKSS
jgi:RNA polymerase sigma factor (TIGR02999 family)